jgi:hypothetical protein
MNDSSVTREDLLFLAGDEQMLLVRAMDAFGSLISLHGNIRQRRKEQQEYNCGAYVE